VPLGRVFALALRHGYINEIPLRRLEASERPRVQKRQQRVLNHAHIANLLAASLPSYRPLLATALYSVENPSTAVLGVLPSADNGRPPGGEPAVEALVAL